MAGLVIWIVFGGVVAGLAYRESETFRTNNGVTPWRMPSWAWAVIGFGSLLLAAVLLAIARRTTDPVVSSDRVVSSDPAAWFPYAPIPAAAPVGWAPYAPIPAAAPAGWRPDPSDPRQLRYWDGTAWTQHVTAAVPQG